MKIYRICHIKQFFLPRLFLVFFIFLFLMEIGRNSTKIRPRLHETTILTYSNVKWFDKLQILHLRLCTIRPFIPCFAKYSPVEKYTYAKSSQQHF